MKQPNIPNPLRNSIWYALRQKREDSIHGFPLRAKAFCHFPKYNSRKSRVANYTSIRKNRTHKYASKPLNLVNMVYHTRPRKRGASLYAALAHSSHAIHIRKVIQTFGLFSYKPYNERKFLK